MDLSEEAFKKAEEEAQEIFVFLAKRMTTDLDLSRPEMLMAIGLHFSERLIASVGVILAIQRNVPVKEVQRVVAEEWVEMLEEYISKELGAVYVNKG